MSLDVKWQLPPARPGRIWNLCSRLALRSVGVTSKIWGEWFSRTKAYNIDILHDAFERPAGQPLITVCNHVSCIDDPLLWGNLKWRHLLFHPLALRWSLGAHDICFTNDLHALFFLFGKTVPVIRGNGVYQKTMDFVLRELNKGDWVHVFPEGKVNMTKECIRIKWGVGRLIAECKKLPTVIPFWHVGLDDVLPNEAPYRPRIGKDITVYVGKPIDFKEQLENLRNSQKSPREMRKHITDRIQAELRTARLKAEKLHFDHKATKS